MATNKFVGYDTNSNEFMATNNENKILYKDLSYKIQGLIFDIRNDLGSGHKESIYQKSLEKELIKNGIKFIKEPLIKIYSNKGEFLGLYRPDFLIEDKIIIELKAVSNISGQEFARVYDYLRNSEYELAYLVNFASSRLYIKRFIFTNDREKWFNNPRIATNRRRITTKMVLFVAISLLFVGICGLPAQAARLYFTPQESTIGYQGDFFMSVNLEADKSVNAISAAIHIPEQFEPNNINEAGSIINFWIDKPLWNSVGRILNFSGIIPGGAEKTKSTLLVINLKAKSAGEGIISFDKIKTKVYLNTGDGAEDKVIFENVKLTVVPGKINLPVEILDNDPPESFVPEITKDSNIFGGKWFIVFAAQDKGLGMGYYEIQETREEKTTSWGWKKAESPYLLEDQKLKSYIYLMAIDKAGNQRLIKIMPKNSIYRYTNYWLWGIILLMAVFAYYFGFRIKIWQRFINR